MIKLVTTGKIKKVNDILDHRVFLKFLLLILRDSIVNLTKLSIKL